MKKIGIFGGTFDPVHFGHISIAKAALDGFILDEVLVMTGGMPPHKREQITEANLRYEMTRLAFAEYEKIKPFDFEISKKEYTYTAKTLTELKSIHPDWEIYFIIGEDSLLDLPKWYEPQTVADNCILLIYPRGDGNSTEHLARLRREQYGADIRIITAPIVNISSTEIRNIFKSGKSIDGLVPEPVIEFIKEKRLYI